MKDTQNFDNKIIRRLNINEPLTWTELDNNFRYSNIWESGITSYEPGMVVLWNDYISYNSENGNEFGCLSHWMCTVSHTPSNNNRPGKETIDSKWDRIYQSNADTLDGYNSDYFRNTDSVNLIPNNIYSSFIDGYNYTNGFLLKSVVDNKKSFNRLNDYSINKIKSEGYYSLSFWYKVENYNWITDNEISIYINDNLIGKILTDSFDTDWKYWSSTTNVNSLINISGYINFIGTFDANIIISDLVLNRSTSPSQTYSSSQDDIIKYNNINNVIIENIKNNTNLPIYDEISLSTKTELNYTGIGEIINTNGLYSNLIINNNGLNIQSYINIDNIKSSILINNNSDGSMNLESVSAYKIGDFYISGYDVHVNNVYSFFSEGGVFSNGSIINNYYGLFLGSSSGNITNNYGVYQNESNAKNIFKGDMYFKYLSSESLDIIIDENILIDSKVFEIDAMDVNINAEEKMIIGSSGIDLIINGNLLINNNITSIEIDYLSGLTSNIQSQFDNISHLIPKLKLSTSRSGITGGKYNDIYVQHDKLHENLNEHNPCIVLMHKIKKRYNSTTLSSHSSYRLDDDKHDEWQPYNSNILPKIYDKNFINYINYGGLSQNGHKLFDYDEYDIKWFRSTGSTFFDVSISRYDLSGTTSPYSPLLKTFNGNYDRNLTVKNIIGHRIFEKSKKPGEFMSLTIFNDNKKKCFITNNSYSKEYLSPWELKHGKVIKKKSNLVINNFGLCIRIYNPLYDGTNDKFIYGEVSKFGVNVVIDDYESGIDIQIGELEMFNNGYELKYSAKIIIE